MSNEHRNEHELVYLPYFLFHVPLIRDASPGVGDQPLCASQGLQGFPLGSTRKVGEEDEIFDKHYFSNGFLQPCNYLTQLVLHVCPNKINKP